MRALCSPAAARTALRALPARLAHPIRALLSNTASPTRFRGSEAVNVIPREVTLDLDVRTLPESSPEEFLEDLWRRLGERLRSKNGGTSM